MSLGGTEGALLGESFVWNKLFHTLDLLHSKTKKDT